MPKTKFVINLFNFSQSQPTYQTQQTQKYVTEEPRTPPVQRSISPTNYGSYVRNGIGNSLPRTAPQQNAGNLSELDTLLQDLSSARYGTNLEKHSSGASKSSLLNDSIKRPSVDSLLDELSNAQNVGPIYAVPNG